MPRFVGLMILALGLAACDGKERAVPAATAPATTASEATAPAEQVVVQQSPQPDHEVGHVDSMAPPPSDMMSRSLVAQSEPVTLTILVHELRTEGGTTRLVEHSRVDVQADAALGCGQGLTLATPLPASATHANDATAPHWAVLDVDIGGARCRSVGAREGVPGAHAVSGFDMEPISTAAPQAAAP